MMYKCIRILIQNKPNKSVLTRPLIPPSQQQKVDRSPVAVNEPSRHRCSDADKYTAM